MQVWLPILGKQRSPHVYALRTYFLILDMLEWRKSAQAKCRVSHLRMGAFHSMEFSKISGQIQWNKSLSGLRE